MRDYDPKDDGSVADYLADRLRDDPTLSLFTLYVAVAYVIVVLVLSALRHPFKVLATIVVLVAVLDLGISPWWPILVAVGSVSLVGLYRSLDGVWSGTRRGAQHDPDLDGFAGRDIFDSAIKAHREAETDQLHPSDSRVNVSIYAVIPTDEGFDALVESVKDLVDVAEHDIDPNEA